MAKRTAGALAKVVNGRIAEGQKKGQFAPGYSGLPGGDAGRARRALNADTVREMHLAFQRGGREAINKVMKQSPAIFLKLLVLLVPRELEVTHSGGVKALSDEQIEAAIAAIEDMLAKRQGEGAKVIEGEVAATPSAQDS